MYIGKLGDGSSQDDGIYVLLKEVMDNAVDEYMMGFGKKIDVSITGREVRVRDYGRGIPLGKVLDAVSRMNTGAKYDSKAFKKSVGLNGVGVKAVNALSSKFIIRSIRDGQIKVSEFEHGVTIKDHPQKPTNEENGVEVIFQPDEGMFGNYFYISEYVDTMLKNYVYLNAGLVINFNGTKFLSKNGLVDLLNENMSKEGLYPIVHLKGEDIELAFTHGTQYGEDYYSFVNGQNTTQGGTHLAAFKEAVKPDQLSMLQTHSSAGLNWYAIFLGYPILGIWYWCTDQTIVQRVLGSRTERDAQHGALFAGLLKILPLFIIVFPGVVGYVLFRDVIGADANQTLPVLLVRLIPTGLKGIIAAGLLAALMSTIAAALNSSATLVAVDIVKRIKPETPDRIQVRVGQIFAVVVMLLAMAWSTQGGRYTSIFEAINTIASYLAPPITTVFLWGVFWRRGTRQAALTTLIAGFLLGVVSFLVDLPVFGTEKVISEGWGIPFMMQAWWMFCLCSVLFVVVSLLTPRPDPEKVNALTWKSPAAVLFHGRVQGLGDPRILAGGLLTILAVLYIIFR